MTLLQLVQAYCRTCTSVYVLPMIIYLSVIHYFGYVNLIKYIMVSVMSYVVCFIITKINADPSVSIQFVIDNWICSRRLSIKLLSIFVWQNKTYVKTLDQRFYGIPPYHSTDNMFHIYEFFHACHYDPIIFKDFLIWGINALLQSIILCFVISVYYDSFLYTIVVVFMIDFS
eukprot:387988_1